MLRVFARPQCFRTDSCRLMMRRADVRSSILAELWTVLSSVLLHPFFRVGHEKLWWNFACDTVVPLPSLCKAAYFWLCCARNDASLWRHTWPWPGFVPGFFLGCVLHSASAWNVIISCGKGVLVGRHKFREGVQRKCVCGRVRNWVNCFFRVMSLLLLKLRPLRRVRITGLYNAFWNLLRWNC
jgi:hypothetical protein